MTGGSLSQRSGGLSFGTSSDNDEAGPLRQRLLDLGETLVACRREEQRLLEQLEATRPGLRQLEQRQAALEAERTAARRSHGPLLERCNNAINAKRCAAAETSGPSDRQRSKIQHWHRCKQSLQQLDRAGARDAQAKGIPRPGNAAERPGRKPMQLC